MPLFDVYPINPINIVRAQGTAVWDEQGNEYLDLYGGHAVISIGHTHPRWVERIERQLRQIAFYSNSVEIPVQREVAERLGAASGHPEYQLFLCNSGAEANENALKLASFHTGRKKVIAFRKAFHGRTSLAVAATDNPAIVAPVNQTDNVVFLPFNDEAALADCFAQQGPDIACVIIETIQGVGGITVADDSFLQAIRRLCSAHGALFIADEVQCGFGRTGSFFAADGAGVEADIFTMAKGMGNGFPVGGTFIAPFIKPRHGLLGTTFGGAHLPCAAALAVLEVMEEEDLLRKSKVSGDYLIAQLRTVEGLQNVRGRGLMIGFDVPEHLKDLRRNLLQKHRIFTGEAKPNVIRLLPALNITQEAMDRFLSALRKEVEALAMAAPVASAAN